MCPSTFVFAQIPRTQYLRRNVTQNVNRGIRGIRHEQTGASNDIHANLRLALKFSAKDGIVLRGKQLRPRSAAANDSTL